MTNHRMRRSRLLFELRAGAEAGSAAGSIVYRSWVNCDDTGVPFLCSHPSCTKHVLYDCFLCETHLESECGVRIGPSTVAGLGLFATRKFKRNEIIVHYGGEVVSADEMETRYGCLRNDRGESVTLTAPYALGIDKSTHSRDAARVRGAGAYVNSSEGLRSGVTANARLGNRYIRALKTIEPGTEILCTYGTEYWQFESAATMTHCTRLVTTTTSDGMSPYKRRRQ